MKKVWIRLYTEVPDDPKVQSLPLELFKFWINLLCLVGRSDGKIPTIESLSWSLRMPYEQAASNLEKLRACGLIDGEEPHSWKKRQYESDTSTARVKRFRKRFESVSGNGPASVSVSVSEEVLKENQEEVQKKPGSVLVEDKKATPLPIESEPPRLVSFQRYQIDEQYSSFRAAYSTGGASSMEQDWAEAFYWWNVLDWDQRKLALDHIGTVDPAYRPLPRNYLSKQEWKRPPRPKAQTNLERMMEAI